MINFVCSSCGSRYSVKDEFAGRACTCQTCQASMVVPRPKIAITPAPSATAAAAAPPARRIVVNLPDVPRPKLAPRQRRLGADFDQVQRAFRNFPLIRVCSTRGSPPDSYQVEYQIRGLARGNDNQPLVRDQHLVEIQLTAEYPRQAPKCRILTPIFHPNFDPTVICIGDHWAAQERLVDLIVRIGEMIAYQRYNVKSPLDGEAAKWADLNPHCLPIDGRDLRPPERE